MKKVSLLFLQGGIVLFGGGILFFLLLEPHLEGRNVGATWVQIYFHDPFLTYVYVSSLCFFFALFQAVRVLQYIKHQRIFSAQAVVAIQKIKYCSFLLAASIVGAEGYFFLFMRGKDDIAGGVMMGLVLLFITAVVGIAASVGEKTLQSAVDMKSEQDLTV